MEHYIKGQTSHGHQPYVECTYTEGINLTQFDDDATMNYTFNKGMNMEDTQTNNDP
jgi:hypothetical protein